MATVGLHNIIEKILQAVNRPLTTSEIAYIITEQNLWRRPKDKQFPKASQIAARVNNYDHLFEKLDGRIALKASNVITDRMFRLTWNTTGWQYPIPHKWKRENQRKKNTAFENQFGFGGEEWLFNPRYIVDTYQYGYIRGAKNLVSKMPFVTNAWLFSINQETKERFIVGKIKGLEIIKKNTPIEQVAIKIYNSFAVEAETELEDIGADKSGLGYGLVPNVRFKIKGNELFDIFYPSPWLVGNMYNRFIPYTIDSRLRISLEEITSEDDFAFNPGVARSRQIYDRFTSPSSRVIRRVHSEISSALEEWLKPQFSKAKKNLSIEKTHFGNNIADVVINHGMKEVTIMEIKTSGLARKNIREALGQLLDYGCWYDNIKIKRLIIVAPSPLSSKDESFIRRLQKSIRMKISYWQYIANSVDNSPHFVEIF